MSNQDLLSKDIEYMQRDISNIKQDVASIDQKIDGLGESIAKMLKDDYVNKLEFAPVRCAQERINKIIRGVVIFVFTGLGTMILSLVFK